MRILGLALTTTLALTTLALSSAPSFADTVSTSSRMALFQSQLSVLDNRASKQYSNSVRLQPPRAIIPVTAPAVPSYIGRYNGPLLDVARVAARKHVCQRIFSCGWFSKNQAGTWPPYRPKARWVWRS